MSGYEDAVSAPLDAQAGRSAAQERLSLWDRFVVAPLRGWALIWIAVWNSIVFSLVVYSASSIGAGVGLFILPWALGVLRSTANAARRRSAAWSGVEIEEPYRPYTDEEAAKPGFMGRITRLAARLTDPQTWRDLAWSLADALVGSLIATGAAGLFLYGVYGLVIGAFWGPLTSSGMNDWYTFIHVHSTGVGTNLRWAAFPVAAAFIVGSGWAAPALIRLHGRWTAVLLGPTAQAREEAMARRVARLTETRADARNAQAAELRRIERDLHDGAQARLVAMGMNLGAAEALLDKHPDAAKTLLAEARESSAKALTELRDLVRGIHPPVLSDRGLGDAVRALALDSPLEVEVSADIPGRIEPAVESAAYFAVSELLTNVAKHAKAQHVRIDLWHGAGRLRVTCTDDGVGGARIGGADAAAGRTAGSGLAGIERRIGTFDGVLAVRSPVGGPTIITLEIPCGTDGRPR